MTLIPSPFLRPLSAMSNLADQVDFYSLRAMMQRLVSLGPDEYHTLVDMVSTNPPLAHAIDTARQANIALTYSKKALDAVDIARDRLHSCQRRLNHTLEAVVDVLYQSPLGTQIPNDYYSRLNVERLPQPTASYSQGGRSSQQIFRQVRVAGTNPKTAPEPVETPIARIRAIYASLTDVEKEEVVNIAEAEGF